MFSVIALILMLVLLVTASVGVVWAVTVNMYRGLEVRRKLAARLAELRLGRVISLSGVDAREYLHTQRISDIETQIRNCATCHDTERCDSRLERGDKGDFGFCPNEEVLSELGRRHGPRKAQA